MKSITRRIEKLEETVFRGPETELPWRFRRRRKSGVPARPFKLRFGHLRRLPQDYEGERHIEIAKHLPAKDGQEWVEFEEVPGPAPSAPSERGVGDYMDVVLV
jgi:hypothetical protein